MKTPTRLNMRKLEYRKTKSLGSGSGHGLQPIRSFVEHSDGTRLHYETPEGVPVNLSKSKTHNVFERFLSIFAPVRKGEGFTSVLDDECLPPADRVLHHQAGP